MAQLIEVKVPDIGDFKDVAVIEVMVKPGEVIAVDTGLIMVESDKASMEIPSTQAGTVRELKVKVDDKVSEGSVILVVEAEVAGAAAAAGGSAASAAGPASAPPPSSPSQSHASSSPASASPTLAPGSTGSTGGSAGGRAPAPALPAGPPPARYDGKADVTCEMLVLGAGPGGYSAAFRSADLGMKTVLVERYPTLGGVCLNVGCIPSKALLHTAAVMDEVSHLPDHGIRYGKPEVDLDKLRAFKDGVIGKLTGGLAGMAKARKVQVVTGVGSFLDPHHLAVVAADGKRQVVKFDKAIIAAGSQAVKLPFLPEDERIVDSTGALQLRSLPKRMLVIGGGIIGLEMATVYSGLGTRIDVVEMLDGLMQGADRDLVKVWEKKNAHRFDRVMLGTKTVGARATKAGIEVDFEGPGAGKAPAGGKAAAGGKGTADGKGAAEGKAGAAASETYDLVLVAVGRSPNGGRIGADKAGVAVSDRGFIAVDRQMRTNVGHIFAIGDLVGQPMLAHKAVHEAHVAAEAAHGEPSFFDARQIPSVAYTDPEVAWAGLTEDQCKAQGIAFGMAVFPWAASGRAIANGRDEGFTKLLFDKTTNRVLGGGIVGTNAGDLISEVCLAVEMGCVPADIGKTIHPHPTLGESIGMAAEVYEGHCTDLPPQKKR